MTVRPTPVFSIRTYHKIKPEFNDKYRSNFSSGNHILQKFWSSNFVIKICHGELRLNKSIFSCLVGCQKFRKTLYIRGKLPCQRNILNSNSRRRIRLVTRRSFCKHVNHTVHRIVLLLSCGCTPMSLMKVQLLKLVRQ